MLILTRKIGTSRSVCRINDETVTLNKLREITDTLIDIHGQHEHQSLLSASNNLVLLDSFCPKELSKLKSELSNDYGELKKINQRIQEGIDERLRKREIDILDFEINEIKDAKIKENEEEELEQVFKKGKNISKINDVLVELLSELENESIGNNIRDVFDIASLDDSLNVVVSNLNTIEDLISETIHYTNRYLDSLEYNEREYESKEKIMTFEEILPGLKAKKKYVRTGWGGAENYVQLFDTIEQNGVALEVTPYFLINVSGEGEGFSMWSPTPCDVLATDWVEVHD